PKIRKTVKMQTFLNVVLIGVLLKITNLQDKKKALNMII
ncbi:MAG: Pyruvate/2-oxoacid:ferredoxin oxidoreductase gamma subunit, partial [Sediminicola sp.]